MLGPMIVLCLTFEKPPNFSKLYVHCSLCLNRCHSVNLLVIDCLHTQLGCESSGSGCDRFCICLFKNVMF